MYWLLLLTLLGDWLLHRLLHRLLLKYRLLHRLLLVHLPLLTRLLPYLLPPSRLLIAQRCLRHRSLLVFDLLLRLLRLRNLLPPH
jgi:hypothetical protein